MPFPLLLLAFLPLQDDPVPATEPVPEPRWEHGASPTPDRFDPDWDEALFVAWRRHENSAGPFPGDVGLPEEPRTLRVTGWSDGQRPRAQVLQPRGPDGGSGAADCARKDRR